MEWGGVFNPKIASVFRRQKQEDQKFNASLKLQNSKFKTLSQKGKPKSINAQISAIKGEGLLLAHIFRGLSSWSSAPARNLWRKGIVAAGGEG